LSIAKTRSPSGNLQSRLELSGVSEIIDVDLRRARHRLDRLRRVVHVVPANGIVESADHVDAARGKNVVTVVQGLVDTLLRLSRGDAGSIRLSRQPLDLGDLARDVAESLGILAEERSQSVALDIRSAVAVSGDRLVLREAVTNVLDNAIKYNPDGSTIAVGAKQVGDRAVLTIADEGPGIPPEHRQRIFDRFFRVDEARSRERGGAGLGLAIATWAVDIYGGQITVEGRGKGSEFRIVLPVVLSEPELQP